MRLEGRVALITGAARRVGRAIAVRLSRAGCDVALHYGTSAEDAAATTKVCTQSGVRAESFQADLEDAAACRALVERVVAHFGRLDVLVNNASIFGRMPLDEFNLADWERHLRVNLTAPMVLTHAARSALAEAGGRVVNLCDISTQRPWPDHLAYMASKGGLDTLTKALARAMAPSVNVVGIAPGVAAWPDDYDQATRDRLLERVPLRRAGSPEDIAEAVHFVVSEGDYVTGVILPIDGGRSVV